MPSLSAKKPLYITRNTADSLKQRSIPPRLEGDRRVNKRLDSTFTETRLILRTYFYQLQDAAQRKEATTVTNMAHSTN